MDAISYFFTTLGIHNFLLALLSFLLGLLLGWMIWARNSKMQAKFDAKLKAEQGKVNELNLELEKTQKANREIELALSGAKTSLDKAQKQTSNATSNLGVTSGGNADRVAELEAQLATSNSDLATCRADLSSCKTSNASQPVAPVQDGSAEGLKAKNMEFFAADLASGKLREDEKYGLLYTRALEEEQRDDLTLIHGVAKVLNKTLNDEGVYRFRQIALWSPQICEDFSEKISFKGRIERDDWIGQCKKFHEEKYGEKI